MAQVLGAVYAVIGARAVLSDQKAEDVLAKMMQEFAGMVGHKGPAPEKSNSDTNSS